ARAEVEPEPAPKRRRKAKAEAAPTPDAAAPVVETTVEPEPPPPAPTEDLLPPAIATSAPDPTLTQLAIEAPARLRRPRKGAPTIVDTSGALEKEEARPGEAARPRSAFQLPSVDMLVAGKIDPNAAIDRERVLANDIQGHPVYADLSSMPHVIVAGATGAGKSVGLNVMLLSLLYRRTPDELRLLMVDPKVVELAPFDRIPHMLLPVVTDMKQAATALKWAVDEMERRYQLFADAGTKNLGTYNKWVERVIRGDIRNPAAKVVISKDHNGFTDAIRPGEGE